MKKFLFLLIAIFSFTPLPAQKALKPVRAAIKAKNGTEALKQVQALEKDSIIGGLPQLYELGKEAQILINDAENEKAFLKQNYDTARFFSSTLGIYHYVLCCEREEQRLLADDGRKMKFHRENAGTLHRYYPNITAGGRYFFQKQKYADAMPYLRQSIDVPKRAIWGADKNIMKTTAYAGNAFLYQQCAYLSGQYDEVERYKTINLADTTARRSATLEILALAATERKDTTALLDYLKQGVRDYPDDLFFFTRLADHYGTEGNYKGVLTLANGLLQRDSTNAVVQEAKCLALMNLKRYDEAIRAALACMDADSTQVEPYYYVGAAYCTMALDMKMPASVGSRAYNDAVTLRRSNFEKARIYLEKYRQQAPDERKKWAPLLYHVYFSLNLGKQFEEISRMSEAKS